jgi:hypothetical protein
MQSLHGMQKMPYKYVEYACTGPAGCSMHSTTAQAEHLKYILQKYKT